MKLWSIEARPVWSPDYLYVHDGWSYMNNCEYCFSSYGAVVALDIVFTSHVTKRISYLQKRTQEKTKMKRDVGMACQKNNTNKKGKI